jgi:hypothetical protein
MSQYILLVPVYAACHSTCYYISTKKMRGEKKCGISLKQCRGSSFSPKQMEFCTMSLCYVYFEDNIFGSFFISTKMYTNTVSLVKIFYFLFTKYLKK